MKNYGNPHAPVLLFVHHHRQNLHIVFIKMKKMMTRDEKKMLMITKQIVDKDT